MPAKAVEVKKISITKDEDLKTVEWKWNPAKMIDHMIAMPYSFSQAIADVIDNSLDAGAENVDIYQNLEENTGKRYVIIQDDAKGMTEEELHEQIGLGAEREYEDHELGKFGTGLKLSSLSQAREVSIFSKTKNGKIAYRRISANHISDTKRMELLTSKLSSAGHEDAYERLNINESGTYKLYDRNIKFEVTNSSSFVLNENKNVAQLDLNKIKFPLKIRNWKKGDSFKPLGMKKNKKVSDFLIDKKVPNYIKIFQCVILSDNNIVWLIDHQIHDEYKVTNKTKKVFNISVN